MQVGAIDSKKEKTLSGLRKEKRFLKVLMDTVEGEGPICGASTTDRRAGKIHRAIKNV